jgi:glycosyltransferase involved in cell wall biosynthesis
MSLRILHVAPSFHPAWAYGGIPRCVYELARAQARQGDAVSVWTTDAFDAERRCPTPEEVVDGIVVRRFRNLHNGLAYHRQLYLPVGIIKAPWRDLAEFDVVHVHSHRHLLEALVGAAALRRGIPYVFTGNGTVPAIERYVLVKRVLDLFGADAVLKAAAACVAVSEAEIADYEHAGVARQRVRVIPNGVRLDEFARLPPRGSFRRAFGLGDGPLIVFVGKITPRKGVDVLLRALARLPADVRLVVAGNFMMPEAPIRAIVEELHLQDRVLFPGLLLGDDRNAAYVDADVVAYPSTDEIFGLVAAEALMCGAPVVVCDDSGCGELVRAAGGGRLVPYGDHAALAIALQALLADRAERQRCASAGRRFVETHLGWERVAEQTRALYAEVVAAAARPARRGAA